ncbi:hypothetical protein [Bradyrhizobium sp. Ghvi]|nr:hypothetical protein [Bradyrhizobium sp. Ghvi]
MQELDNIGRRWTALVLVFLGRQDAHGLADIFLMNEDDVAR